MAEPHWTGYVGMITGVVGAVMGSIGYWRSNKIKSLDLRLELRKAVNEVERSLSQLERQMEHSNRSRERVASATGMLRSGMMLKWKKEFEIDAVTITRLKKESPSSEDNFNTLSFTDLESKLADIDRLQGKINDLSEKYQQAVKSDDEERTHLREDMRSPHIPTSLLTK